ncbi:malonyl-CoA O-methyltransferase [Streptomyces sp. 150FB]|uniref:ACP S-malonyltransferase n=1 Tax=Streptomyces sp. 150FB TaxID=1576605 RepID=UPI0005894647|nr:ACP S-malonyltransferase [Streptomyces sp. 150FB]KIF72836.1 malonyl-CoA O-methyltransferase [Streptomyces sp. 150FB]
MSGTALPVVFMFSGQGSQYYGMGKELFDANEVFRTALLRLDAVVGEHLGESVVDRVFDPMKPRNHPLTDTRVTHPAIVMIELALAQTLKTEGIEPDYVLGSSLGEYAAAVVAGSLSPEDCLRVLVRQAGIMAGSPRGGMLAVLDGPEILDTVPELRACEVAARNHPGNFVVAGREDELAAAEAALRAADVLHLRLPVEYAFHSRLLDPVAGACRTSFEGVEFAPPRIPWITCVGGGPVEDVTAEHFWHAARRTIDFERAVAGLQARGDFLYLDLGPSGSLHNFVRALLPTGSGARSLPLLSQFAKDTDLLAEVRKHAAPTTPRKAHGMKVYGFPGQGSQRRGMGRELFERFPEETAIADEVLGYSIEELCVTDPRRRLGRTEFTQPALYVVGALSYLDRLAEDPVPPDHVIGHSLGEYVALFAAGVFDFAGGLRLVRRRGELMATAGRGAMAAVVGVEEATVTRVLAESGLDELDLANYNAMDQFVVSGPGELIDTACAAFESAGARTVRLHVSAPLHSRYMRPAAEEFGRFLDGFTLHPPKIPVLANVDARPYTADTVRERLTSQIASPVRWTDTVRTLMAHGDFEFTELGPGRVLTKLVTRIREAAEPLPPTPSPTDRAAARTPAGAGARGQEPALDAEALGARSFRERYGLRHSYAVGSMYGGVSGREVVRAASKAGLLGFLGIAGLQRDEVERQLHGLAEELGPHGQGVNLLYPHRAPEQEAPLVDALLQHGVGLIEVSGYPFVTEELVRFRFKGGRILAKVSRTDLAAAFLAPPPEQHVAMLLAKGSVTEQEAAAAAGRPMADDLCVEADGGWLTGAAGPLSLLPAVLRLRDEAALPGHRVHVGCAGGIGTPEAAAAAFLMGADFVLTGSVNQCSVEAATSAAVKDLLQEAHEYDVDTAPWSELFEHGVQARYLKRGQLFPARASRLHDLWRRHASVAELDEATRKQVFDRYLGGEHPAATAKDPDQGPDPRTELAAVFRAYFRRGFRLAVTGDRQSTVDYLVNCGPAMGAFNQAVAGTSLQPWRARTLEAIADFLMDGAAAHVTARLRALRPAQRD